MEKIVDKIIQGQTFAALGVDIEVHSRFDTWKMHYTWDVLQMIFTEEEWRQVLLENVNPALLFSAKEATVKALGVGFSHFLLNEIEIQLHSESFIPSLTGVSRDVLLKERLFFLQGLWTMDERHVLTVALFGRL
ncbi:MAG: hypothetical protein A3F67_01285 [Verrucomicrobia bacterium RIFCSPHIGHO2_12_FULL_41_10]|nr:MAG: hypothetical protein A3F67_01285 [Verrucomicrobia bacterium RIFCSPHIGHO2_12_FULL_41_10]